MSDGLARGFKSEGGYHTSNSEEQKKAEVGLVWNTYFYLTRRDKSVAPIEHARSHGCVLFGGQPAVETIKCQHRRPT
jgi:hypothetical protein